MEAYLIQLFSVVLNIILLYGFQRYITRQKDSEKRQDAVENGLRSLLRDRIVRSCMSYTKQGHVPIEELEIITDMFEAYKNLGGNGATEAVYKRFLSLPTVDMHNHTV